MDLVVDTGQQSAPGNTRETVPTFGSNNVYSFKNGFTGFTMILPGTVIGFGAVAPGGWPCGGDHRGYRKR